MVLRIGLWMGLLSGLAHGESLMTPEKNALYLPLMPRVEDTRIDEVLRDPSTIWYDAASIVPGYQDSMGDPKGFRPNTIQNILIDLAVPGGWSSLFSSRGFFNFPFKSGGADLSDNMEKINFWVPPREGGELLPVVYWKLNFSHWRWLFPKGTLLGEVLLVRYPDGERRVFEVRVRERAIDGWKNSIYRPFLEASDLADAIRRHRPNWFFVPALKGAVEQLNRPNTLVSRTLETTHFKGTFARVDGSLDNVPDFGDPTLAKEMLQQALFLRVGSRPWKADGTRVTHAASTLSATSIVPVRYDGGMLPVDDVSCRRCHSDAGRQIGEFYPDLVLYGELWGEDETFSWHPFDTSAFVQSNGDVANFNNDNRRLRSDFVNRGWVKAFSSSIHTADRYREIPRAWSYKPVREETDPTAEELECVESGAGWSLNRRMDGFSLDRHSSEESCEEVRRAARGGVVCRYFTESMPVGPEGWKERGWRASSVASGMGLGRRPHASKQVCMEATGAAAGGVVCTDTGLGAKATNIRTNRWCGASSQLMYCMEASRRARNEVVCSFPSSGTGAEAGWVRTKVTDQCDYQGSATTLSRCSDSIPASL